MITMLNRRKRLSIALPRVKVLREIEAVGCVDTPVVELWNKIDSFDPEEMINVRQQAANLALEIEADSDPDPSLGGYGTVEDSLVVKGPVGLLPPAVWGGSGLGDDDEYGYITADVSPPEVVGGDKPVKRENWAKEAGTCGKSRDYN